LNDRLQKAATSLLILVITFLAITTSLSPASIAATCLTPHPTTTSAQSGFDFWISVSPNSSSVTAGEFLGSAGTVSLGLISGAPTSVGLSLSGLPSSVGADNLRGYPCSAPCFRSFGIMIFSKASPGTYMLTITGAGGGQTHSATYRLTVK
jgi:hypothetical protein